MPLYSHSTGSRTVYAPGSRLAKSRTSQSMQTLLWRPSLSGGGGTKSAFHSTGQSTTSARRIRFHPSHGPRMGRPSGPPLRQSTHLDLVEIRQCVPDIEGTKVAVAPRLLLLPGGGRALWGDVVGYGGRSGGGEGGERGAGVGERVGNGQPRNGAGGAGGCRANPQRAAVGISSCLSPLLVTSPFSPINLQLHRCPPTQKLAYKHNHTLTYPIYRVYHHKNERNPL